MAAAGRVVRVVLAAARIHNTLAARVTSIVRLGWRRVATLAAAGRIVRIVLAAARIHYAFAVLTCVVRRLRAAGPAAGRVVRVVLAAALVQYAFAAAVTRVVDGALLAAAIRVLSRTATSAVAAGRAGPLLTSVPDTVAIVATRWVGQIAIEILRRVAGLAAAADTLVKRVLHLQPVGRGIVRHGHGRVGLIRSVANDLLLRRVIVPFIGRFTRRRPEQNVRDALGGRNNDRVSLGRHDGPLRRWRHLRETRKTRVRSRRQNARNPAYIAGLVRDIGDFEAVQRAGLRRYVVAVKVEISGPRRTRLLAIGLARVRLAHVVAQNRHVQSAPQANDRAVLADVQLQRRPGSDLRLATTRRRPGRIREPRIRHHDDARLRRAIVKRHNLVLRLRRLRTLDFRRRRLREVDVAGPRGGGAVGGGRAIPRRLRTEMAIVLAARVDDKVGYDGPWHSLRVAAWLEYKRAASGDGGVGRNPPATRWPCGPKPHGQCRVAIM